MSGRPWSTATPGFQTIVRDANSSDTRDTELLNFRRPRFARAKCEYLDALIRTCGQYFDTLIELDSTDQQVVTLTASYTKFYRRASALDS